MKNKSFCRYLFFSLETRLFQDVAAAAGVAAVTSCLRHKKSEPSTSISRTKTEIFNKSSEQKIPKSAKLIRIAPDPNSPTPPYV